MPMRLSVGLTRKVGRPNYGSLGASAPWSWTSTSTARTSRGRSSAAASAAQAACAGRSTRSWIASRPTTRRRVAIAATPRPTRPGGPPPRPAPRPGPARRAAGPGLDAVAGERFGVDGPEGLSVAEAGLIDELQHVPADATA